MLLLHAAGSAQVVRAGTIGLNAGSETGRRVGLRSVNRMLVRTGASQRKELDPVFPVFRRGAFDRDDQFILARRSGLGGWEASILARISWASCSRRRR